jgi:predicted  nucleic acid-binding Zn-ribbon protein
MKPSVQKIITKLAKEQENKVEKVELNRYDFKSFQKEYDNSFTSYRSEKRSALNKAKAAADAHFKDIRDILDRAERSIDEFGSKADELGVDYRSTKQFQEFQELKRMLLSADSRIKEVQKDISKIM